MKYFHWYFKTFFREFQLKKGYKICYPRLESVLDRSWEIQPVTWSQLTWWDPVPCGQSLLLQIYREDLSIYPSPALSMLNNPPTPHRKR